MNETFLKKCSRCKEETLHIPYAWNKMRGVKLKCVKCRKFYTHWKKVKFLTKYEEGGKKNVAEGQV